MKMRWNSLLSPLIRMYNLNFPMETSSQSVISSSDALRPFSIQRKQSNWTSPKSTPSPLTQSWSAISMWGRTFMTPWCWPVVPPCTQESLRDLSRRSQHSLQQRWKSKSMHLRKESSRYGSVEVFFLRFQHLLPCGLLKMIMRRVALPLYTENASDIMKI